MTIDYVPEPVTRGRADTYGPPWPPIGLPRELLDRHGARVLGPWSAGLDPGEPRPGPTVCRADVLLVPGLLLAVRENTDWLDETLAGVRPAAALAAATSAEPAATFVCFGAG